MGENFRGVPIKYDDAWVIMRRQWDGACWYPLVYTVSRTRAEAIRKIAGDEKEMRWYKRERRRGNLIAAHCIVEPLSFSGATDPAHA